MRQGLETQLGRISNWLHVSFKKNILTTFDKVLDDDEEVDDVLEGFYRGAGVVGSGSGAPGILCITSKRILFLLNGKSSTPAETIGFDDLLHVDARRTNSSVKITLQHSGGVGVLTSTKRSTLTRSFLDHLKERVGDDLVVEDEGILNEQINRTLSDEERLANLNFLHNEARKIIRAVNQYKQFNNEPAFLQQMIDDLLYVTFACVGKADNPPDETKLFIAMVFMYLRQRLIPDRELVLDVFRYDSLPLHHRRQVLGYWHIFHNEIQKVRGNSVSSLKSLQYLHLYDRRQDSSHFDRMAASFFAYAQCVRVRWGVFGPPHEWASTMAWMRDSVARTPGEAALVQALAALPGSIAEREITRRSPMARAARSLRTSGGALGSRRMQGCAAMLTAF